MDAVSNIILYSVIALIIAIFSFMAVTSKKILRAATYLLFVLLGTAVFYFQLGYQFLGGVQIAVYAGGIMVLFVFAILLTHKPDAPGAPLESHRRTVGLLASGLGAVVLLVALFTMPAPFCHGLSLSESLAQGQPVTMHDIGYALTGTEKFRYLLPFEAVSVLLLACIIGGVVIARKR